jgi:hypothetical protein
MDVLVNDLSFHGQFPDINSFFDAIELLMAAKNKSREFGRDLYCHRNIAYAKVTSDLIMQQVVQRLGTDKRNALMSWLTRNGPYWDDARVHNSDDFMECINFVVTDTAIGEAAFRVIHGGNCQIFSIQPSEWEYSPLLVCWHRENGDNLVTNVLNHYNIELLEAALRLAPEPIVSWEQLGVVCRNRFSRIHFSADAFEPFQGHPFVPGAANRILERLNVLEQIIGCVNERGERTAEGHRLYQDYFTGEKSWFSDSSESEKNEFNSELTFKHPKLDGETLFCSWHGKVKTPQIRIHFSWPITFDTPLYVVYVGPKITKR